MLDGRTITEYVGPNAELVVWKVRTIGKPTRTYFAERFGKGDELTWYVVGPEGVWIVFGRLRRVRMTIFRGNGRLSGHSEITDRREVTEAFARSLI